MTTEDIIKRLVKQAAYNFKISQNPYNPSKGVYFKGKIIAYRDCVKLIREANNKNEQIKKHMQ